MIKLRSFICFIVFFGMFLAPIAAFAQTVREIVVEGNQRVEESAVLVQVTSKIDKPVDSSLVESDIKDIYRTGYFDSVAAKLRQGSSGLVLVFVVDERPAIRKVKIAGNDEVDKDTIEEKLNINRRTFLDRRKIAAGIEEVRRHYESEGLYGTEIELDITDVDENQVDLSIDITEGEKQIIRKISFEGNSAFDDGELRGLLSTTKYKWWISWLTGSGVVKEEDLERDVALITRHYLSNGYVDAKISKPEIEKIDDGLKLIYGVTEGEQFNFGNIKVSGDLIEDNAEKTIDGIAANTGDVFNVEILREDSFLISEKFTDIGYAFVNVDPATSIDRKTKLIDVNFAVSKGELIHVNRINISGNRKTRDNVIRRSITIAERELFSSSKIKRSQQLLQRLGYFDEVTITPSPTGNKNEVNLDVAVREGNTGTFSAGAGVSSGDGFIVSTRISENNLFGSGNALTMDINTGSRRENYVLSFDNPRVNDTRWSMGLDALSVEREFDDFDRNQAGGSIRFGYPLWFLGQEYLDDIRFSLEYQLLRIKIDEIDKDAPTLIQQEAGTSTSSSISPRLVRNTIDNPLDPSGGSRQSVAIELAGLGGDEKFWLAQASNTFYYSLWDSPIGNFVFSNRVRLGWGETFNDDNFPLFRRFFPGGINSVRGFDSRELGPKDADGNEFGGNKQLIANFELIFPLIDSLGLKGVAFYDAGNAFDDDQDIEFGDLRQAVGWGVRWRSPIAPLRIEIGYPLDREDGDKSVVTNFSFGAPL